MYTYIYIYIHMAREFSGDCIGVTRGLLAYTGAI